MGGFLVPCVWRAAQLCPVQATTQPVLMSATSDQHERVKASSASLEEQNQRIQASVCMAVQAENTAADVLESLKEQQLERLHHGHVTYRVLLSLTHHSLYACTPVR